MFISDVIPLAYMYNVCKHLYTFLLGPFVFVFRCFPQAAILVLGTVPFKVDWHNVENLHAFDLFYVPSTLSQIKTYCLGITFCQETEMKHYSSSLDK